MAHSYGPHFCSPPGSVDRLAPLTDALPKCLVCVSGVPILERLVRCLDSHGFERLVVVIGYRAEMIRDYLGESFGGIAVEYIVSPLFATTNTLYSLWLARQVIDEPFLLAESDVVFDEPLLAPLLQPDRIAVSRQLPWMSGTTVTLNGDGKVKAIYPPPPGVYDQHCTDPDHFMAVNISASRAIPGPGSASDSTAMWQPVGPAASTTPCLRR